MTIIRTMYCEKCFKQHRPQYGDLYIKEVDGNVAFSKLKETNHHDFGFTPHLIEKLSIVGDVVTYRQVCGMVGCGIDVLLGDDNEPQLFDKDGGVVIKQNGTYWHYDGAGNPTELKKDEHVYYVFEVIQEAVVGKVSSRDWQALLNYGE